MLLQKIEESKNIIISSHINPDGDCIGSGIGLYWALKKKYPNKNIRYIIEDRVPYNYKFLEGTQNIEIFEELKDEPKADVFIIVDSANFKRIGRVAELKKDAFLVNIDHHISNDLYGDINIVKNTSSASEVVYGVITEILNIELDSKIGEALYTGIITDSGNFQYENTTENTFKVAGKILNIGIDRNKIINNVYRSRTLGFIKVLGLTLSEMVMLKDEKIAYFTLTKDFMLKNNIQKDETDGIVEKMLEYRDCKVAVFLKEEGNGKIKGSLRSKEEVDVNEIAKLFDGGGHKKAAGFTTYLNEKEIIRLIKEKI